MKALLALMASPQNNLRVWLEGAAIPLPVDGQSRTHLDQQLQEHGLSSADDASSPTHTLSLLLQVILEQSEVLLTVQRLQTLSSMTPGEALELCYQLGLDDATGVIPMSAFETAASSCMAEPLTPAALALYLLAASFRDCSIMINIHIDQDHATAAVVVVDVEPKP